MPKCRVLKDCLSDDILSAKPRPLSRSRAPRSKRHAAGTSPAHKRCLFQNSSFCWSRKKLENFWVFTKRNIRPYKLNSIRTKFLHCQKMFFTCSPPSLKSGSTSDRMHKVRLAPLIRAGQYLCTEQGSTSAPSGTVPLHRARCTTAPWARCTTAPWAEGTSHSERRVHGTLQNQLQQQK